jgi:NAD(P)-dependent dehydrogenase (short-subunit alcohol dehydrogenase family)
MKNILITGANRGIGKALAIAFGQKGHTVIITARKSAAGNETLNELIQLGIDAHFYKMDVALDEEIAKTAEAVAAKFGHLDLLINNAGIMSDEEGWIGNSTLTVSDKAFTKTMVTNFMGPWKVSKAFIPLLEKGTAAQLLNVSAKIASLQMGSDKKSPTFQSKPFAYNVSKSALNQLTIHLAHALRRQKIRVLSIYPGWVKTDMGGANALFDPSEAANRIIEITNNNEFLSGTFVDYDHELPW